MIQKNQIQKRKSVMQTEKITDTSGLVKKKDYNAKITEIELQNTQYFLFNYQCCIDCSLQIEDKIPNVSNLVIKTDYDAKFQALNLHIILRLIIISLVIKHLTQR